jgi:hypothetical protein
MLRQPPGHARGDRGGLFEVEEVTGVRHDLEDALAEISIVALARWQHAAVLLAVKLEQRRLDLSECA